MLVWIAYLRQIQFITDSIVVPELFKIDEDNVLSSYDEIHVQSVTAHVHHVDLIKNL